MPAKTTKNTKKVKPFSAEQLEEYKELLLQERGKIMQRIQRSTGNLQASRQAGEESADIGGDDFIRETGIAIMSDDCKKLTMIEQAMKNLEKGTYGICQDCQQPIGDGRLRAKPYAKYCISCKEIREKNGDRGPDEM